MYPCGHDNCFTCPFADCIVNGSVEDGDFAQKRGRKPQKTNDARILKKRELALKWYNEHKDEINAKKRAERAKRKKKKGAKT